MRNLDVIKGVYRGNGLATNWSIPFEYTDTSQICVTLTTYADGDYTYEIISASDYTINTGAQTVTYPKSGDPITSDQYITVWRSTDLLQLMDLTNQGGAWPESIEASIDKLTQIVQELMEGLSRTLKVNIGDPETPEKKLLDMQDYVLSAASSAIDASASASSANQAAEAAAASKAAAATSEGNAEGWADIATANAALAQKAAESAAAYSAPAYDNDETYRAGDVVTYIDGNTYRALGDTTGNIPTDTTYWTQVTTYVGDDYWIMDAAGYIVPNSNPTYSGRWEYDDDGYLVPINNAV